MAQEEPVDAASAAQDGKKRKRVDEDDAGAANNKARVDATIQESNILFASRFHLQRAFGLPADQVAAISARMMLVPQLQKMPAVLIPLIESYFGAPTTFSHVPCQVQSHDRYRRRVYQVDGWSSPTSFWAVGVGVHASQPAVTFVWSDVHSEWYIAGHALPSRPQGNWGLEYEIDLFNHFRELQRPILRLACGHVASARAPSSVIKRMMEREECWTVGGAHDLMMLWGGGDALDHTSLLVLCDPADAELVCAECNEPMYWQVGTSDVLAGLIRNQPVAIAPISPPLAAALGRV